MQVLLERLELKPDNGFVNTRILEVTGVVYVH